MKTSGARIFLHDFEGGAHRLAAQFERLAESSDVDQLVVVDVGGDIMARGPEPDLRSPLADSLTLAGALAAGIPTSVVVLGPGADAELPEAEVLGLLEDVGAKTVGRVTADDVRNLEPVLSWHPTEASALVAAGGEGLRGSVAMRRGRIPVPVTDHTHEVWVVPGPTWDAFPLARALHGVNSLSEAEQVMRKVAVDEIDFERRVADNWERYRALKAPSDIVAEMKAIGATHITNRRLADALSPLGLADDIERFGREAQPIWSIDEVADLAHPGGR